MERLFNALILGAISAAVLAGLPLWAWIGGSVIGAVVGWRFPII